MKKVFLAIAAVAAGLVANAAVYDFTGILTIEGGTQDVVNGYYTLPVIVGTAYPEIGVNVAGCTVFGKHSSDNSKVMRYNYSEKKSGQLGIVGNGGDWCIAVPCSIGDVISVQVAAKGSSSVDLTNSSKQSPAGKGIFNVTADVNNLTVPADKTAVTLKYTATSNTAYFYFTNADIQVIKTGSDVTTAVNDADADASFAYSVKMNGQKVSAKVYNEPVVEVSSNGAAKTVVNKK